MKAEISAYRTWHILGNSISMCELITSRQLCYLHPPHHQITFMTTRNWVYKIQIAPKTVLQKMQYPIHWHLPLPLLSVPFSPTILLSISSMRLAFVQTQGLCESWFQHLLPTSFSELVPHSLTCLLKCHLIRQNFPGHLIKNRSYFCYYLRVLVILFITSMKMSNCSMLNF